MSDNSNPKCLTPECQRKPHCRGLCHSCYNVANKLVWGGKTTWEKLIADGKAKPARAGLVGKTRDHFLG